MPSAPSDKPDRQPNATPSSTGHMRPGDEAPPGTPGSGENICKRCAGSGRLGGGEPCPDCEGTGFVNVGIGGA